MSIYTIRSGATAHIEKIFLALLNTLVKTSGVYDLSGDSHKVVEQTVPTLGVTITLGYSFLKISGVARPIIVDANYDLAIDSNSAGNPRKDAVVLYVDLAASPNSQASNVAKLVVVKGTPLASPTAPTDGDIETQIGASNPYIRLANVDVANGATEILNANITDTRVELTWIDEIAKTWVEHNLTNGTHKQVTGLDNNVAITQKDSGGTARSLLKITASDVVELGNLINSLKIKQGNAGTNGHTVPNVADDTLALLGADQEFSGEVAFAEPPVLIEQAGDPSTPATGEAKVYSKDGSLFFIGDDGVVKKISENFASATVVIDGGGDVISTGVKGDIVFPYKCEIVEWTLLSSDGTPISGSIQIDLWKDTYANFAPTVADTITASAKPTISSSTKGQSSTLTGWTTTMDAGSILRVNVDSVTSLQRVTLVLKLKKIN